MFPLAASLLGAFLFLGVGSYGLLALGVVYEAGLWWLLYIGGAVAGVIWGLRGRGEKGLRASVVLCLHAALLFLAAFLGSLVTDIGWDSIETHQRAVVLMGEGWNIVAPQPGWIQSLPADHFIRRADLFEAHLDFSILYPSALLFSELPFGFEGGKGYRFLLLLMAGLLAATLVRAAGLGRSAAWLAGLFVAWNPVALFQLWTLFMDFEVALYASLALVAIYALSWRRDPRALVILAASLLLLALAKRSGPILAGAFASAFVLGWTVTALRRGNLRWRTAGALAVIVVAAGFAVLRYGLPDHYAFDGRRLLGLVQEAVFEPNRIDEELMMRVPPSVDGLSRPEQFLRSLGERTDIYRGAELKPPLSWHPDEWAAYRNLRWPGHGSGGFGPLFSGALVLALLAVGLALDRPSGPGRVLRGTLLLALAALACVFPSWWARWVPFLWVLPLLLVLPVWKKRWRDPLPDRLYLAPGGGRALASLVGALALLVGLANSVALTTVVTRHSFELTDRIDTIFASLPPEPIPLEPNRSYLVQRWFEERGLSWRAPRPNEVPQGRFPQLEAVWYGAE